jgi:hypothetical protein
MIDPVIQTDAKIHSIGEKYAHLAIRAQTAEGYNISRSELVITRETGEKLREQLNKWLGDKDAG